MRIAGPRQNIVLNFLVGLALLVAVPAALRASAGTMPAPTAAPGPPAVAINLGPDTNAPAAVTNATAQTKTAPVSSSETNRVIEAEYRKLMADDDDAQDEVDKWIRENQDFEAKGLGTPKAELNQRIRERFEPIRRAYEDFLKRHPDHAGARVAYGSFLGDLGEEEAAQDQIERALTLDPKNPAIYNNLANTYGQGGSVKKAFEYFAKAIELNPREPLYYRNFGTTTYVFRKDAMEYFGLAEQQVFEKVLLLYSNAMRLDPDNFPLASDVAQSYYGIQPLRPDEALRAWTNALHLAGDEVQREGVYVHLARIKMAAGRLAEARAQLAAVTNSVYGELKARLTRDLDGRESRTKALPAGPAETKHP